MGVTFVDPFDPTYPAGGSTSSYVPAGVLTASSTTAATVADTAETDLWTYTLPANTLNANNKGVRVSAMVTYAANANVKSTRVYFGGTVVALRSNADNGTTPVIQMTVLRTGASAQVAWCLLGINGGGTTGMAAPAGDTTTGLVIKITGQNGTANAGDITFKGAVVEMLA